MKQASKRNGKRLGGKARRRRALLIRRIAAGVLLAGAVALAMCISKIGLSPATLMWGSAAALLGMEALLLSVELPVSKALKWGTAFVCLALLAGGYLNHFYARVDGRFVPKYALVKQVQVTDKYPAHFTDMESLETLDMRGSTVADFEPIRALSQLQRVDVRDNYAFTEQERDALAEALPDCDIVWSVPVKNLYFDSDQPRIDLTSLPLTNAELRELFAKYPDKDFVYRVSLLGGRYDMDADALDLTGATPDAGTIDDALGLLPNVRTVDLRGEKASAQTVAMLCDAHPDVHFMFTCDVPGAEVTTEDEQVTVEGSYDDLLAYMAYIDYMPNLTLLDASAVDLTNEQVDAIRSDRHSDKLLYSVTAFGVKVNSLATELNLDNMPVPSVEAMEECLARLPNLTRVSMCNCGLSEDQMGQLFDAHPEIKFVWWLQFGKYKLRTDATAFTTALGTGNRYGYDDSTFACIRYCTDLMMLDLGHNHITSLESFKNLKKLRVLILADNKLTDISDLAGLEDLEYVELFLNDITDVTPLTGLKKLVDLNLFYNPLYENHKVLGSMTWLQRLWIGGCRLSKADLAALRKALPNTKINVQGRGSTSHGWRNHPHYDTLKQMYEEERYIPFDD